MKKPDCFAMTERRCVAMNASRCDNCAFYCTAEEMKLRREEANIRLRRLDHVTQTYIADRYYGGKYVWHEEART